MVVCGSLMFCGKSDKPSRHGSSHLRYAEDGAAAARGHDDARPDSGVPAGPRTAVPDAAEKHRLARAKRDRVNNALLSELAKRPQSYGTGNLPEPEALDDPNPDFSSRRGAGGQFSPSKPVIGDAPAMPGLLDKFDEIDAAFSRQSSAAPEPQASSAGEREDAAQDWRPLINPRYIIDAIRQWKSLIVALGLLGAVAGVLIAITTPKLYYASAEISVDPRGLKVIDNGVNPDTFVSETFAIVDSQVRVMTSPTVLERVAKELNLASDIEFNGSLEEGWLESLTALISRRDAKSDANQAAAEYLADHIFAERGAKTYVIIVTAASEDPGKAALIANKLVEVYLSEQRMQQSETVKQTTDDLTNRLADLKSKVEASEQKVEAYKAQNDLIGAEGRMIDDEAILRINDQLAAARGQTIALNARAKSIRTLSAETVVNGGIPEELNSPVLTALRGQHSVAKQKRDGLATKLGPRHPERIQAESELESLRSSIVSELRRVSSSMQTDLKRAIQTEQDLAARLAELKARQGNMGEDLVKLRELQREVDANRSVYEAFLLRARQTGEQVNLNTSNIKIIASARPPREPVGTSRKLIAIAGLAGGLALGFALAIAKGIVDSLRSQAGPDAPRKTQKLQPELPPAGGGMFKPRTRPAMPGAGRLSAPPSAATAMMAPQGAQAGAPAQDWVAQPVAPIQAPAPQLVAAPPYPAILPQPVQYWASQPSHAHPHALIPPGPLVYPQHAAPPQPAFVPYVQLSQPWMQPVPQPPVQQPVQVQMPVYAADPPYVQPAPAPIAAVRPTSAYGGNPQVAEIRASINEVREALTDYARRRRM